jgi:hypothetical protein
MKNIKSILVHFLIILEWQSARDIVNFLSDKNTEKGIQHITLQSCKIRSINLEKLAAS